MGNCLFFITQKLESAFSNFVLRGFGKQTIKMTLKLDLSANGLNIYEK